MWIAKKQYNEYVYNEIERTLIRIQTRQYLKNAKN